MTANRYPSGDVLLAEAMDATRPAPTSARATSARASTCCSRASSATPISSPATDTGVIGDLRRRLVNRLEVEAWYRDHPEIDGARGARTGRHQRTAAHRHHRARQHDVARSAVPLPTRLGADRKPCPPPTTEDEANDPRRLQLAQENEELSPELHAMHLYDVDATMEDTELLGMAFHGQQYTLPVYGYHAWWRDDRPDRRRYEYHRRVVKLLQSRRPPDLWLFKAPHHNFHLEAIVVGLSRTRASS